MLSTRALCNSRSGIAEVAASSLARSSKANHRLDCRKAGASGQRAATTRLPGGHLGAERLLQEIGIARLLARGRLSHAEYSSAWLTKRELLTQMRDPLMLHTDG